LTGSILQINISPGGLPKRPLPEGTVTPLGIEGDSWAHPNIHGGPEKALLLIAAENIDSLIDRGWPLFYGALGENLTTSGIDFRQIRIGHQFRIGGAIIEIAKVRAPCRTLDVYGPGIQEEIYDPRVRKGDYASPRWGMSGFYARVLSGGVIRPGDIIALLAALA
jgi:MOSC domain-containing protein YiiM